MSRLDLVVLAILAILGAAASSSHSEAEEEIRTGVVIAQVVARADPTQSYALYLPSSYAETRRWPVIVAFDPLARGRAPVECFQQGAEKYGYVLAGSNNSRNGPMEASRVAAQAVLNDVVQRFSVDPDRIYTAGYSGGARAACTVAFLARGSIAGVIGCAGGFPEDRDPGVDVSFAFCGVVGVEDFNLCEMRITDRKLEAAGVPHRLLLFEGGHSWPPPNIAAEAVEWLDLQAMKSGRRPPDTAWAQALCQQGVQKANRLETAGSALEARRLYASWRDACKGLVDVSEAEAKVAALAQTREFRRQSERELDLEKQELARMGEIRALIDSLRNSDERWDRLTALRDLLSALRLDENNRKNLAQRRQARRLLEYVNIMAFYAAEPLIAAREFTLALTYQQLQAEIHPESSSIQFRIAATHARAGDKKKTLAALRRAAERGYSSKSRIEQERAFEFIRQEPEYQELLQVIQSNEQKP